MKKRSGNLDLLKFLFSLMMLFAIPGSDMFFYETSMFLFLVFMAFGRVIEILLIVVLVVIILQFLMSIWIRVLV